MALYYTRLPTPAAPLYYTSTLLPTPAASLYYTGVTMPLESEPETAPRALAASEPAVTAATPQTQPTTSAPFSTETFSEFNQWLSTKLSRWRFSQQRRVGSGENVQVLSQDRDSNTGTHPHVGVEGRAKGRMEGPGRAEGGVLRNRRVL